MLNLILYFPKRPYESSACNKGKSWYPKGEREENYHEGPWASMCKMGNIVDYQPMWPCEGTCASMEDSFALGSSTNFMR